MAKFKKIVIAGPLVIETVYPAPNPRDSEGVRQGKRHLSSEARQRMNLKYAWQKLELEIAANFGVKDLYCTFCLYFAQLRFLFQILVAVSQVAQKEMAQLVGDHIALLGFRSGIIPKNYWRTFFHVGKPR